MLTKQRKGLRLEPILVLVDETGHLRHRPGERHAIAALIFPGDAAARVADVAQHYVANTPADRRGKVDTALAIDTHLPLVESTIDEMRNLGASRFHEPYDCSVESENDLQRAANSVVRAFGELKGMLGWTDRFDLRVSGPLERMRKHAQRDPIYFRLHYDTHRFIAQFLRSKDVLPQLEIWFESGKLSAEDHQLANLICRFRFHTEYHAEFPFEIRTLFGLGPQSPFRSHLASWRTKSELALADLHAFLVGAVVNDRGDVAKYQRLLDRITSAPGRS